MSKVYFTGRFPEIEKGHLAEFKALVADCAEVVRQEPGSLEYDWFLSPDETVCVVRETYADSSAVFAHMAAMTDLLPRLVELGGGFEAECYGSPSVELIEATQMKDSVFFSFLSTEDS